MSFSGGNVSEHQLSQARVVNRASPLNGHGIPPSVASLGPSPGHMVRTKVPPEFKSSLSPYLRKRALSGFSFWYGMKKGWMRVRVCSDPEPPRNKLGRAGQAHWRGGRKRLKRPIEETRRIRREYMRQYMREHPEARIAQLKKKREQTIRFRAMGLTCRGTPRIRSKA